MEKSKAIKYFTLFLVLSIGLYPTSASIITSVGYVFETFSPYAMIRFFEFSDKGWNITENCLKDMYGYLEGLRTGTVWAIKLYDATSYYGGGAFGSSNLRIHNPNLCRDLFHQHMLKKESPWHLIKFNGSVVPFPVHIVIGHYLLEIDEGKHLKIDKIQQLICFPQSCGYEDLQEILEIYLFQDNQVVKNSTYLKHRVLHENYNIFNEFDFYILISIIISSVFLYIGIFILENYISRITSCSGISQDNQSRTSLEKAFNKSLGFPLERENGSNFKHDTILKQSIYFNSLHKTLQEFKLPNIVSAPKTFYLQEIIDALSIQNVVYNIFHNDGGDAVPSQTGFFVFFAVMLSYAHLVTELRFISNKNQQASRDLTLYAQLPTYLIDVYFFISGSKMALKIFQTFPLEKLNVFSQLMHIFTLMLQKVLSLTPSYTFALFTERLLSNYFHNKIALEIPSYDVDTCRNNILSNLFFMDTFFPLAERCMPWSWFIALEVQFFIIACLLLLLAEIHPKYAVVIGASLFFVSIIAAIISEANSTSYLSTIKSHEVEIMQFNLVYDNISLRIAPYLLGIGLGYILYRNNSRVDINIFIFVAGWLVSLLSGSFIIIGHILPLFEGNHLFGTIFITLGHTIWCFVMFWIILASTSQYGEYFKIPVGHNISSTLAQVSPISLLIGPIIIRLLIFSTDIPINLSEGHIFIIGLGCLLVIYTSAFVMFILFDGPLVAVFDVIIKRR